MTARSGALQERVVYGRWSISLGDVFWSLSGREKDIEVEQRINLLRDVVIEHNNVNKIHPAMQCLRYGGLTHARGAFRPRYSRASSSTVNADEIEFFSKLSSQWWDERGEFAMLHRMNPARVGFIRDKLKETTLEEATGGGANMVSLSRRRKVMFGMSALDIGCGGGLLSEVGSQLIIWFCF